MAVVAGIPVSNYPVAYSLTLPGYAAGVARGSLIRGQNLRDANQAFQTMLGTQTFDASKIPMYRALATTIYGVPGLQGLGSGDGGDGIGDASDGSINWDNLDQDFWDSVANGGAFSEPSAVSPPADKDNGSSWWTDILKTMAQPLAMGVGGRIAGVNPWAKPPAAAPAPMMSSGAKLALIGGAAIVGVYALTRLAKRR